MDEQWSQKLGQKRRKDSNKIVKNECQLIVID